MINQKLHGACQVPLKNLYLSDYSEFSLNFSYLSSILQNLYCGIIHLSFALPDLTYQIDHHLYLHKVCRHQQSVYQELSAVCHYMTLQPRPQILAHHVKSRSSLISHRPFTASDRISCPPSPFLSR